MTQALYAHMNDKRKKKLCFPKWVDWLIFGLLVIVYQTLLYSNVVIFFSHENNTFKD
jgi:hypothetical protein